MIGTTDVEIQQQQIAEAKVVTSNGLLYHHARRWMTFVLATADATALIIAASIAVYIRLLLGTLIIPGIGGSFFLAWSHVEASSYLNMIPIILVFIATYAWRGLYPVVGLGPVGELRGLSISTSMVVLALATYTFLARVSESYSRAVFMIFWPLALVLVPSLRVLIRSLVTRSLPWGEPVAVIGPPDILEGIVDHLRCHPSIGMKPAVCFVTEGEFFEENGYTMIDSFQEFRSFCNRYGIRSGIIGCHNLQDGVARYIEPFEKLLERTILVVGRTEYESLGITVRDLGGILGLEVQHNLLNQTAQIQKRVIDVFTAILGLIAAMPFIALIAAAIKLETPGPVFFTQMRVGRDGKLFKMWKFRTMHRDAHGMLNEYLNNSNAAKDEWEKYQKLREDPRITRLGRILRQLSLDELPQLVNVLKGEMSLVGPRPFFSEQSEEYGDATAYYTRVPPGITGLWQVNGRNQASFVERAKFDEVYVRNWSVWLDLYILVKTPFAVFKREGAY